MVIYHMIRLDEIEGFEWDAGNSFKSLVRHDVGQGEIEQVFVNEPLLLLEDAMHSALERRFHAFGKTHDGRLLHISFTLRDAGRRIRVISARSMSKKERARYDQES